MTVEISKIKEIYEFLTKLNNEKLENITWVDGNNTIRITEDQINDWKYTGLTNWYFAKEILQLETEQN